MGAKGGAISCKEGVGLRNVKKTRKKEKKLVKDEIREDVFVDN